LTFADIVGHIADTVTHASIANVKVTVIGTTSTATTDGQGNFTIPTTFAVAVPAPAGSAAGLRPILRDRLLALDAPDNILAVSIVNSRGTAVFYRDLRQSATQRASVQVPALAQGMYLVDVALARAHVTLRLLSAGGRMELAPEAVRAESGQASLAKRDAVTTYAVSCENAAYKTREANVIDSGVNEIRLVPASSSSYYYFEPVQLDDGITTGTVKAASMSQSLMEGAALKALNKVNCHEIHSILVCKDSKLVFEEYFYGNNDTINFENNVSRVSNGNIQWSRTLKHYIASATKAITSTVVSIALDKMGLTPDEKIAKYLPSYSALFTGQKANLTLKNCLNMESGLDWNEWGGPDLNNMWSVSDTDFTAFVLNHNSRSTPGTEWVYCSGLPNVELHVVQNMVQDSAARFIRQNLLAPLGITDIKWETQHGKGMLPEGAARLFIRPRDMLKWGMTCLNNGQWQGVQVIPSAWLTACRQVQYNGNYSNHFWITTYTYGTKTATAFAAEGDGGNYICMFPSLNMVVVFTGGLYLESPTYDNQITDFLTNYILPAAG
jgi:hypothetical protein